MLHPKPSDYCCSDPAEPARLVVVIDTEEDYWPGGFSRHNTSVQSMRSIHHIQDLFDAYHITPVYVVDYAVASQPDGYGPLQEFHAAGRCHIGAHLHPWVNPPFAESVNRRNSYPGNLPRNLEAAKLQVLGDCIAEHFGVYPVIYKAGRYGIGPHTAAILEEQGYEVDVSICPHKYEVLEGGPDFRFYTAWPYWFGTQRRLLELPLTVGFTGMLRRWGTPLYALALSPSLAWVHPVGILARLGLVKHTWLSPEGYTSAGHTSLVRALYHDGIRIFNFAFHSPSVEPGHTPYVRSQRDLEILLDRCRRFFDFFLGELGGRATTPLEVKEHLARSAPDLGRAPVTR